MIRRHNLSITFLDPDSNQLYHWTEDVVPSEHCKLTMLTDAKKRLLKRILQDCEDLNVSNCHFYGKYDDSLYISWGHDDSAPDMFQKFTIDGEMGIEQALEAIFKALDCRDNFGFALTSWDRGQNEDEEEDEDE